MMNTYFDKYNEYLDFLLKVECSRQGLDYDEALRNIISGRKSVSTPEPLMLTAKVSEPDNDGNSIVSISASGGKPPYTGVGNFIVQPGTHSFTVIDSNNEKKIVSIIADFPEIESYEEPEPEPEPEPKTVPIFEESQEQLSNYDLEFDDGYYIGVTQNGLMHGFGVRYWDSGKKWEGEWFNGEANGHIIVSFDDIVTYDGNMVNGLPNGKGTYTDPDNGRTYIGDWVDFRREGSGKLLARNGEKIYDGEWRDDKFNGYGLSFLRGICRYDGNWVNGQRSGEGIAYDENGNVEYQGLWENNERIN
jgi:hypothetical protein